MNNNEFYLFRTTRRREVEDREKRDCSLRLVEVSTKRVFKNFKFHNVSLDLPGFLTYDPYQYGTPTIMI